MSGAVSRIIYLNGEDTGLKAWSRSHAKSQLWTVLRKRGDITVTPEILDSSYTTSKGRVDFTYEAEA